MSGMPGGWRVCSAAVAMAFGPEAGATTEPSVEWAVGSGICADDAGTTAIRVASAFAVIDMPQSPGNAIGHDSVQQAAVIRDG